MPDDSFPHVEGVTHRFVEVRGARIHVAEAGSGPPVLLQHGWPEHWYMWRHQLPALAASYRVICPDLRGHGWSSAPPGAYLKEELADDLIALLDVLGIGRVRLAGHDWGGWTGFLACLKAPERFERFVALNIPHPFLRWDSDPTALAGVLYQLLLGMPVIGPASVRHARGFVPFSFGVSARHRKFTPEEVEIYAARLRDPARAAATSRLYRSFIFGELWAVLAGRYHGRRLSVPTRVLFGVDDVALSPKLLRGLEAHADHAEIELVRDAGHFIAEEQPELVTARLLDFFAA